MANDFNERDPFYQQGKRHHDQAFDRTMQQLHQAGSLEQLAQQRLWFLLAVTLPKRLWQYSPLSVFLFVIPLALYIVAAIAITSGLNNFESNVVVAIGYLIFGLVCLALMFVSIFWASRKTVALNRIIAMSQMVLVALFTVLAIVRTNRSIISDQNFLTGEQCRRPEFSDVPALCWNGHFGCASCCCEPKEDGVTGSLYNCGCQK
jgi:hypothetical protein